MARALWVTGPDRTELRDEPLPVPGPADVVVRALVSGFSPGTGRLVLAGRVPPEVADGMRAPFPSRPRRRTP